MTSSWKVRFLLESINDLHTLTDLLHLKLQLYQLFNDGLICESEYEMMVCYLNETVLPRL